MHQMVPDPKTVTALHAPTSKQWLESTPWVFNNSGTLDPSTYPDSPLLVAFVADPRHQAIRASDNQMLRIPNG
jgi:hypothetical protein